MSSDALQAENEALKARLEEAEETLRAIRAGAVDALVVGDGGTRRVYTLDGADRAYRVWVEQISQGAATLYPDGTIAYCNPRLAELIGRPSESLPMRALGDFVASPDRARYEDLLSRCRTGAGQDELVLVRADGRAVPVLLTLNALPLESGAAVGVLVTDLTAQKQHDELSAAFAALRDSDEQRRTHVEQVKDYAIFRVDTAGRATTWNEGVQRVLGFAESEFVGCLIARAIFTPADIQAGVPEQELLEAATTGTANNDRWMRKKDGALFFATGVTTALRDDAERLIGFTKVMRDQTQWKLAADELRDARTRLEEADRRKNEFLATLAHELRNPLAPIRTGLEILRLAPPEGPAAAKSRAMMERQLAHMVRLIDDLLDVSRISSGKIELRRERLPLRTVFEAALETSLPLVEAARHDLAVTLPDEPVHIDADLTRIAQVVSNLLNNAAKYTPEGGRIELEGAVAAGEVVITVRDTGIGIRAHLLESVFELFSQAAQSAERSHGGLGIGLSLVKRLVELHEGTVAAYSDGPGRGSEFVVRLPAAGAGVAVRDREPRSKVPDGPPLGRRVLVVDDSVDGAESLAMMLSLAGHETHMAHGGLEALALAKALRPEFVLMDIGMPGMDGHEVARRLRLDPAMSGAVLVAITGWGSEEDKRRAREAGFDLHLTKPIAPGSLDELLG